MQEMGHVSKNEHYNRGIVLYDRGLYAEAIAEFEQVLGSASHDYAPERKLASFHMCEAYANLGLAHLRRSMYRRAEEELRYALMIHPQYADLHCYLGVVYYKEGRYDSAEEQFREALAINPEFARALMYLGMTRLLTGNEDGLASIADAVFLQPAYNDDRCKRVLAMHSAGDTDQAIRLLGEIAETDVDRIGYLLEKGLKLMGEEKYSEAASAFLEAMPICPHYADLRHYLGLCYMHQDMLQEAIAQFRKALVINLNFVAARVNLAATYHKAGMADLAVEELDRVLRLTPENPEAVRILSELRGRDRA